MDLGLAGKKALFCDGSESRGGWRANAPGAALDPTWYDLQGANGVEQGLLQTNPEALGR